MAIAKFKRFTASKKTALILVKANVFVLQWTPVYIPSSAVSADILEDAEFQIPDGYKLIPMTDEDGNARTTKPDRDGVVYPLHSLGY